MYDSFGLYLQSYINGKAALTSPASVSSAFSDFILWCTIFAKVTNKQKSFLFSFLFSFFLLLLFFDFQLPADLLHARPKVHAFNILFVVVAGTRHSVRCSRLTRRQSPALSQDRIRDISLCETVADKCQDENVLATLLLSIHANWMRGGLFITGLGIYICPV